MKTTKKLITAVIFAVLSILSSFFNAGCGNDNLIGTGFSNHETAGDMVDSITVNVTKLSGGYKFDLTNRTIRTIVNDFHVQFDTTVKIIGWSLAWSFDPNTTNLNKGKIGEKVTGPNQQPVQPGQTRYLLWVELQFNGKKVIKDYNWQATKDGVVVQSGRGTLPD
jgi:hypothetical protein